MDTSRKYRAILKRPDESFGHMTNISLRLENLQRIVGGYIEVIDLERIHPGLIVICDEEGKCKDYPFNMPHPLWPNADWLAGDIIVLGVDGEEFTDVPIEFAEWKEIVKKAKEGME